MLERDQFTCRYCGQFAPTVVLHVDHVIAHCEGGSDDLANLVTACSACNIGKEMYRASCARAGQRKGARSHRPLQGAPSLDPFVLAALGDNPGGLTVVELAALVDRDRTTLVKVLNRMADTGEVTFDRLKGMAHNPTRLYRLVT